MIPPSPHTKCNFQLSFNYICLCPKATTDVGFHLKMWSNLTLKWNLLHKKCYSTERNRLQKGFFFFSSNHNRNVQHVWINSCNPVNGIIFCVVGMFTPCIWRRAKWRVQVPDDSPAVKIKWIKSRWVLQRLTAPAALPNACSVAELSCRVSVTGKFWMEIIT